MSDRLSEILNGTLKAIETGKEQIFYIAESTRTEFDRLVAELEQLRVDIAVTINEVDKQQKLERISRQSLMVISRDFKKYTEREMMDAYANAKEAQVRLQLLQSKESQLRTRRDEVERALKQTEKTFDRAETLLSQVSMAVNLLQSGIDKVGETKAQEQYQDTAIRIIKAQEEERLRVAREVHDGPAQTLANIVLRLEIAGKLFDVDANKVKKELKDLQDLVRSNLQDIRRIIFDLRPMALDDLGVVPAVSKYLENYQATYEITPELSVEGRERRMSSLFEVAIFRLIQEGMSNIAKHANTDKAQVYIRFQENSITTKIIDFGKGFNAGGFMENPGDHYGLIGMRERVELFKGKFFIQSSLGKGTVIEFTIPTTEGVDQNGY